MTLLLLHEKFKIFVHIIVLQILHTVTATHLNAALIVLNLRAPIQSSAKIYLVIHFRKTENSGGWFKAVAPKCPKIRMPL